MNKEFIKVLKHRHKVLAKKAPPDFKNACNDVVFALGQYLSGNFTLIKTKQYLAEKRNKVDIRFVLLLSVYNKVLKTLNDET